MRFFISLMAVAALSGTASAQELSPIQRYLQQEAGYAPPELADAPLPPNTSNLPYTLAQSSDPRHIGGDERDTHLNSGIIGMNF